MKRYGIWILLLALLVSSACTPGGWQDASASGEAPALYPDYKDIVIPGNIAPMNFNILNPADACVAVLSSPEEKLVLRGPEIRIPEKAWRRITASARGGAIQFSVYIRRDGTWLHLPDFRMEVSADEITSKMSRGFVFGGAAAVSDKVYSQLTGIL